MRQLYAARSLSGFAHVYLAGFERSMACGADGITVCESLLSVPCRVDWLVLPIPASPDDVNVTAPFSGHNLPLEYLPTLMKDDGMMFGGRISGKTRELFGKYSLSVADITEREDFSVLNAVPTAEGAVQLAMEEMPVTISGRHVLITGMGRISRVLCRMLTAMGARVTVCARKCSDLAWAEILGCNAVHITKLDSVLPEAELIFNTVPAPLFRRSQLTALNHGVLLIDLASKPGGVDFDAARELGVKVIWALSLPGKVAPVSSGEIIASTVMNIINERSPANERA